MLGYARVNTSDHSLLRNALSSSSLLDVNHDDFVDHDSHDEAATPAIPLTPLAYETLHHQLLHGNPLVAVNHEDLINGGLSEGSSEAPNGAAAPATPPTLTSRALHFLHRYFPRAPITRLATRAPVTTHDGVFANLHVKTTTHELPLYADALVDSAPAYSSTFDPNAEDSLFVHGLPVGLIVNLAWNLIIVALFQYVGFLMLYLLHTNHAARYGAEMGLGVTLVQWGWGMARAVRTKGEDTGSEPNRVVVSNPDAYTDVSGPSDSYTDGFRSKLPDVHAPAGPSTADRLNSVISLPFFVGVVLTTGVLLVVIPAVRYVRVKMLERKVLEGYTGDPQDSGDIVWGSPEEGLDEVMV